MVTSDGTEGAGAPRGGLRLLLGRWGVRLGLYHWALALVWGVLLRVLYGDTISFKVWPFIAPFIFTGALLLPTRPRFGSAGFLGYLVVIGLMGNAAFLAAGAVTPVILIPFVTPSVKSLYLAQHSLTTSLLWVFGMVPTLIAVLLLSWWQTHRWAGLVAVAVVNAVFYPLLWRF